MSEVAKRMSVTGWMPRSELIKPHKSNGYWVTPSELWVLRGKKDDWHHIDWPPVKVRITVEVLK